jgi:hypothetical protein
LLENYFACLYLIFSKLPAIGAKMNNKIENCPLNAGQATDYFVPEGQQQQQIVYWSTFILVRR